MEVWNKEEGGWKGGEEVVREGLEKRESGIRVKGKSNEYLILARIRKL